MFVFIMIYHFLIYKWKDVIKKNKKNPTTFRLFWNPVSSKSSNLQSLPLLLREETWQIHQFSASSVSISMNVPPVRVEEPLE